MVSMDAQTADINWCIKNKFRLDVGVDNTIDNTYPDVCWFKQGVFVFTSINISQSANGGYTLNLQGKDKTALLNGDLGGIISAPTDFGQLEDQDILDNGEQIITLTDIPIVSIIRNAVHFFAGEPMENIIINDVENYGLELLEQRVDEKFYLLREIHSGIVSNLIINSKQKGYYFDEAEMKPVDNLATDIIYYDLTGMKEKQSEEDKPPTIIYSRVNGSMVGYYVIQSGLGDTIGYRKTELTYPGELVANVGETLVSVLDKIKNMFSSFEYFFDIDGRFIFQKKKNYVNESYNNLEETDQGNYAKDLMYSSSTVYQFENANLFTAFSNSPNITNLKNDFSIWGKKTSVSGEELPIHYRYAIDFKPEVYVSERREKVNINDGDENWVKRVFYTAEYDGFTKEEKAQNNYFEVDWRELIYQMALDYYNLADWLNNNSYKKETITFENLLKRNNPDTCANGRTGYEMFYTDQLGFWRQLYFPGAMGGDYEKLITLAEKRAAARWVITNDSERKTGEITKEEINKVITDPKQKWKEYYSDFNKKTGKINAIIDAPETLTYYFDFMDANSSYGKYAISCIGDRAKAINDDKVNSIYYKETPEILLITDEEYQELIQNQGDYQDLIGTGYTFIKLTPNMENYFHISAQGKSAWDELQNQLYQFTNFAESITITSVPIYYLEPNNRILVNNSELGINGEYIISKITVPLAYNGTTSITATKAIERIY